ncbi:unnamed protein product [Miscanthus lutarioriparius]|uniref:PGG domain-containing protein n=1 Tax=Miscanthus lutarioriparius TaxID=422564 RepID=A0A811QN15_9POAL|nr:unnamed protein product [Miscanthus lutarioriparius]
MPRTQDESTHQQRHSSNGTPTSPQQKQEIMLELRKYILLLASLVATVTYAAGFSPPGDVWQDTAGDHIAGDPIIRDTHYKQYVAFFYCNATAFAASLVVPRPRPHPRLPRRQGELLQLLDRQPVQEPPQARRSAAAAGHGGGPAQPHGSFLRCRHLPGHVAVASYFTDTGSGGVPEGQVEERHPVPDDAPASLASGNPNSGSGGGVAEPEAVEKEEERQKPKERFRNKVLMVMAALPSVPGNNPQSSSGSVPNKVEQDKAKERFRKVLMLLATFAVSITYLAGLSTPGGFWDVAGAGHGPGDAILKDRHNTRLAVFFGFNTLAFVASLLIIVVLLDTKLRKINAYGFIVVALFSLVVAYNAGSCRQTDTTVYVFSLIPAVLVYILFLYFVADHIHATWEAIKKLFRVREGKTEKEKAADKARSLVLLLATLAATITYQAGLEPPGGVWQDNSGDHTAGDPILLTTNPRRYKAFFYCNSVSLVASLVAIMLVQRKHLLKHHVLEAVMILDLFGLIGAYAAGSCRDVITSIHAMALAGAVLVYVVIHVIFITLDDDTRTRSESDKKKDKELVEKTRKRLLLFAILAATITYQAGLTPPGGFLLQDDQSGHHAGDPVLLYNFPRRYKAFFYCNSVSFMLSIALIILLVNPNLYRPAIRTHALSVCTAVGLFGLLGAYAAGSTQHLKTSIYIFVLVAVVVVVFFIVLLFLVFWFTSSSKDTTPLLAGAGTTEETDDTQDNKEENTKRKKRRVHAK